MQVRCESPEELEMVPAGSRLESDMHPEVSEEKRANGCWYVVGSDEPFEPALPATVTLPS